MNLDVRRQKSQVLQPGFDLVNCSLSGVGGLLVSSSLSETLQTGYSTGVTVRLESALDLVKKMERAKERHLTTTRRMHPEEIPKNLQGRFSINSYFIKFVAQNLIN